MIPDREQLLHISNLAQGELREVPFAVLLHALSVHRRTVQLEIRRHRLVKTIVIEAGTPIDCRSNLVHETLGRFLVEQGKLAESEFTSAFSASVARGVQLGEVLVERGLITSYDLYRVLQQNLAKKLLDGFTWSDGSFRLLPETPDGSSPLKVNTPQLILTGITRFAPQEEVDAAVGSLVGKQLALNSSPYVDQSELRQTPAMERLFAALGRPRGISELAGASALAFEAVTRLVYAAVLLGLVAPEEEARQAEPEVERAAPRRAAQPAEAIAPEEREELQERVMNAFLNFRRQDPFDLLGLPEEADLEAIRGAYLEHAHRFAPWRFVGELAPLAEKAEELFLTAAKGYAQLADEQQRGTLLYRRKTLREEPKKTAQDQIKTDLLDPAVHYKTGREAMDEGDYETASQHLGFASDCDPTNGLYRAELAYCRWLRSPDTAGEEAVEQLKVAQRMDPSCGLAFFYQGEILGHLGRFDEAEPKLRRAIKLMAPDRRPIEMLKTLAAERKSKRRR